MNQGRTAVAHAPSKMQQNPMGSQAIELWMRRWALLIALGLAACSPRPAHTPATEAQIDLLASDAHVVIGDTPLVLPVVALPEYSDRWPTASYFDVPESPAATERLRSFTSKASDPANATALDRIQINIRGYGSNESDRSFERICPRLTRRWSRAICADPWAPVLQAAPLNGFYLANVRAAHVFDGHITVGGERVSDQLRAMRLRPGELATVCDKTALNQTLFCTAALRLSDETMAVWTVWDGNPGQETHDTQAKREATLIQAFVAHAVGPREDVTRLLAIACESRRPERSQPPNRSDPCLPKAP